MHTTRRPVPSKAALRALRHLAYVASGTACGAAALVYEERRRRIRFFKQVADNGRIIRSFADRKRKQDTAAEVLEDYDAFGVAFHGEQPSSRRRRSRRRSRSRTLDDVERGISGCLPEAQDSFLPSRVEKGYDQLTGAQHGPAMHTSRQASPTELPNRAPERTGRRLARYPIEALEKQSNLIAKALTGPTAEGATGRPLSEPILGIVEAWSQRFKTSGREPLDLLESWERIQAATADSTHSSVQALLAAPLSEEALIRTALELELPDLLMHICTWADSREDVVKCAQVVATTLLASKADNSMFEVAVDWLQQRLARIPVTYHGQETVRIRLSLLTLIKRFDYSQQVELLFEEVKLPDSGTLEHMKSLVSTLVTDGQCSRAADLLLACLRTSQIVDSSKLYLATWTTDKLLARNDHFELTTNLVYELRKIITCSTLPLLARLWQCANEPRELLDMFSLFDLAGIEDAETLGRLSDAMFQPGSTETAIVELYGRRSRLWVTVLVRSWQAQPSAIIVVKKFWNLQRLVGIRPLDPVLYDSVLRLSSDAGLSSECAKIERYRKSLVACTSNDATIFAIMKASRRSAWGTVREKIAKLKIEGFCTMQEQKRMRLFDPMFAAYVRSETDVQGLYLLALELANRTCSSPTPAKTVRLLSSALVRLGRIDTLTQLHLLASELLRRPLRLTSVDIVEVLRSYYYAFRPTTAVLADLIRKLYQGAWCTTSRFCIPLLLMSASHEAKFYQQRRSNAQVQKILTKALSDFDRPSFRRYILHCDEKSITPAVEDSALSNASFTTSKVSGPLVFELTGPKRSGTVDMQRTVEQPTMFESTAGDVSPSDESEYKTMMEALENLVSEASDRESSHGKRVSHHFFYWKTKSLMHASSANGDHERTAALLQRLMDTNPIAPTASLASLGMSSVFPVSPALGNRMIEQLQLLGTDTSLARLTKLISQLSAEDSDISAVRDRQSVDELKDIVRKGYSLRAERGHLVTHSLATAVANALLSARKPGMAVEILQFALKTFQVPQTAPGPAAMLTLLKAYLWLGHMAGIRWVVGQMLRNNEYMNKNFTDALWRGRDAMENNSRGKSQWLREHMGAEVGLLRDLCLKNRADQIKKSWDVGNELVKYLIANVAPVDEDTLDEDTPDEARKQWVDAKIVETVCRDIMTISRRSWHHSKLPMEIPKPEHVRIRTRFGETNRQRGEVEVAA